MTQVVETEVMGGNVRDIVNRLSRDLGTRGQFSIPQQNQERRAPSAGAPPPQPQLFIVTYAYTASQGDELTLTVGDTIEHISDVEDGWSKGKSKSTGAIGMFPTNFVTLKPATAPTSSVSSASSTQNSRPKNEVVMRAEPKAIERTPSTVLELKPAAEPSKTTNFGGAPASVSTESAPEKTKEMARVKFVYKPQHEDEMALSELDVLINITNKNCGDAGWFEGELNGRKGLFPDNFVELVQVPMKTESGAKYATVNSARHLNFTVAHKPPPLNPPQPAVPPKPAKITTVDSPPPSTTNTITSTSTIPPTNPFTNPSTMPIATTSTSTPQKNNFAALRDKMSANLKVVAPEQVSSVQLKPAEQRERASSMETAAAAGDSVVDNSADQVAELQHITKNRARPPKNRPMSMVMNRNRSSDESPSSGRLSSPSVTPTTANPMSSSMFVPSVAKEVTIPANSPFKSVAPPSSATKPALRPIIGGVESTTASNNDPVVIRKVASPEAPKSEGVTSSPPTSSSSEFVSRSEYDALLDRFRALESRVLALEKSQKSHF